MEPSPTVENTSRTPPIRSTRFLAIVSPTPAPSIPICSAPSRSNGSKSLGMSSSRIPTPVSLTATPMNPGRSASHVTLTFPPDELYLEALESRFNKTWSNR